MKRRRSGDDEACREQPTAGIGCWEASLGTRVSLIKKLGVAVRVGCCLCCCWLGKGSQDLGTSRQLQLLVRVLGEERERADYVLNVLCMSIKLMTECGGVQACRWRSAFGGATSPSHCLSLTPMPAVRQSKVAIVIAKEVQLIVALLRKQGKAA